jgi:hypothetical protein
MNESMLTAMVVIALIGLGAGLLCLERARRRRALYRWAGDNGYRLIAYDRPVFTEESPFPFTVSKAQQVYYISVVQKDGHHKSGWLLLGSGWFGSSAKEADIKWDA